MKITIHKNELARYFMKDYPKSTKIGREKFNRWIDIPEYIQVDGQEDKLSDYSHAYQLGYKKGANDKEKELTTSALNKTTPNYLPNLKKRHLKFDGGTRICFCKKGENHT